MITDPALTAVSDLVAEAQGNGIRLRWSPREYTTGISVKRGTAEGGPYSDLVKAAERCTARVIHPGLPRNPGEAGMDKWIARASKFN